MKRIITKIITIIMVAMLAIVSMNTPVFATTNLYASTTSVHVGDSFTITVRLDGIAAWNVHVSSSGPVSGCTIAQADASEDAMNTSKTFTASCTATGTGTIWINLYGDTTTESGKNEALAGSISVLAVEKEASPDPDSNPTPDPVPSQEPSYPSSYSGNSYQPTRNQTSQPSDPILSTNEESSKSSDTDVSISISGYVLSEEKGIYKTTVPYNISEITIKATPKDEKTTITGDGVVQLETGENSITITATAEDGTTKTYNLKITREENSENNIISTEQKDNDIAPVIIVLIVLLALALGLIIALTLIIKKQKKQTENKKDNSNSMDTTPPNTTNPYNPTGY
ncbi:cadherin-like beta sandwich domain-containing protein [Candidatus Saccharibacteria bacterium]|nr:cadherin-like beta sandwich domain-containing protein [Candidatus Saccharibacteria bacterium]